VPRLQRLAVYTADALAELEAAFLPAPKRIAAPATRKLASKGTSTTSGKASGKASGKTPAPRKAKAAPAKPKTA
jgi:hypothetical protein